jgi:tetratricopeptide (TPR) repeat protein
MIVESALFFLVCAGLAILLLGMGWRLMRVTQPRYYGQLLADSQKALREKRLDDAKFLIDRGLKDINSLRSLTPELSEAKGALLVRLGEVREAMGDAGGAALAYRLAAKLIELTSPALRFLVIADLKAHDAGIDATRHYLAYIQDNPQSTSANDPLIAQLGDPALIENIAVRDALPMWVALARELLLQRKMTAGWVWHILARAQEKSGQTRDAINTLYEAAQRNYLTPAELNYLGQLSAGDPQMTLYAYRQSLLLDPTQTKLLFEIANSLISSSRTQPEHRQERLAEAAQFLQKACAQESGHPEWWRALGKAQSALGDLAGAKHALQQAVALDPMDARSFAKLGEVLRSLHEDDAAEPALLRAAELNSSAQAWKEAGLQSLLLGHWAQAVTALQTSLKLNGEQKDLRLALGKAHSRLEHWADVIETLSVCDSLPPSDTRRLARAHLHLRKFAAAITTYQLCLQKAESSTQIQLELGYAHHEMGQWREVVKVLSPVANHPQATLLLAHAHFQLNELDEARQLIHALTDDKSPQALHIAASIHFATGDLKEAERCWRAIPTEDVHALHAWMGLGAIHEMRGETDLAVQCFANALQRQPDWAPSMLRLGICQARLGQWAEAVGTLEGASPSGQMNEESTLCLSAAYLHVGNGQKAQALLRSMSNSGVNAAVCRNNTYIARHHLAEKALKQGDYANAASWWELNYRDRPEITSTLSQLTAAHQAIALSILNRETSTEDNPAFDTAVNRIKELAPNSVQSTLLRALALLKSNQAERAANLLQPVAQRLSRLGERYILALSLWGARQPQPALKVLGSLILPDAHWQGAALRGYCLFADGQWQPSADAFEQGIVAVLCKGADDMPAFRLLGLFRQYMIASVKAGRMTQATAALDMWSNTTHSSVAACAKICLIALKTMAGEIEAAQSQLESRGLMQYWQGESWVDELSLVVQVLLAVVLARAGSWQNAWCRLDTVEATTQIGTAYDTLRALLGYEWAREMCQKGDATAGVQALRATIGSSLGCAPALHGMAVLAFQSAVSSSQSPKNALHLDQAWNLATATWMSLIYSTTFWSGWNMRRERAAGILLGDDELRGLVDTVFNRFDEQLNRLRSAGADNASINLLKARVEYEKTCASLMRDHLREVRVAEWPNGMACGARMLDLIRQDKHGAAMVDGLTRTPSSASAKLNRYALRPAEGFPTFLTENGYPRLAVDWLMDTPQGLSDIQRKQLKSSAYLALGNQLADSGENWKVALESYRRAHELGTNMSESRDRVVKCGIERSREILNGDAASTDQALQALQTAKYIAGNEPRLASNIAAIYAQKAEQAANEENLNEAARLFRTALSHSNEAGIQKRFADLLERLVADAALISKNRMQAIALARELVQMERGMNTWVPEAEARHKILFVLLNISALFLDEDDRKNFNPVAAINITELGRTYDDDQQARGYHAGLLEAYARQLTGKHQINPAIDALNQAYQIEKTQERRTMMALLLGARAVTKADNNDRYGALSDVNLALQWDPSNRELLHFQWQLQR